MLVFINENQTTVGISKGGNLIEGLYYKVMRELIKQIGLMRQTRD